MIATMHPTTDLLDMKTFSVQGTSKASSSQDICIFLQAEVTNGTTSQSKITSATINLFSETAMIPALPPTLENVVINQFSSLRSLFTMPQGLTSLQHLSINGFHFADSEQFKLMTRISLQSLTMNRCSSFRLVNLRVEKLVLKDCKSVLLMETAIPTLELQAVRVNFIRFPCTPGSKILKVQLEETNLTEKKISAWSFSDSDTQTDETTS